MKDNQIATLTLEGTNGEVNEATGQPETAPTFNEKFSVEAGGESVDMAVSEDGKTATVTPKNLEAGAAPVAVRVKCTSTSDAEGQNALPDAIWDEVLSNPPANSVALKAVITDKQ